MNWQFLIDFFNTPIGEIVFSLILGIVQGITEFLPISSTAHLRLVSALLLGGKDIGLITSNVIQLGTSIAIIQYFWPELKKYFARLRQILTDPKAIQEFIVHFQAWWNQSESRVEPNIKIISAKNPEINETQIESFENLDEKIKNINLEKQQTDTVLSQLIVGTIPIVILGFLLKNFAAGHRSMTNLALFVAVGAGLLAFAEYLYRQGQKLSKNLIISRGEVLLIGLFQSLAIFPGMSRSGSTLAGSLLLGRNRSEAVKFSFLLSVPALILSGLADLIEVVWNLREGFNFLPKNNLVESGLLTVNLSLISLIISFVLAYLVGIICLKWLLKYLSNHTSRIFIIYRLSLAFILILIAFLP